MAGISRRRLLIALGAVGAAAAGAGAVAGGVARRSELAPSSPVSPDETAAGGPRFAPVPRPAPIRVISRAGWRAREPQAPMQRHTPVRLTLHHTAVPLDDARDSPARLRQHQDFHMDDPDHDYPDIAYHFMVDRRGNIFEGRDLRYRGDTATGYDPTGHFLVCCEGDYDRQQPTVAQAESVAALFAWASREYGIDPRTAAGHNAYADTSCPGESWVRRIRSESLRRSVQAATAQDRDLRYLSASDSRRAVALIESGSIG